MAEGKEEGRGHPPPSWAALPSPAQSPRLQAGFFSGFPSTRSYDGSSPLSSLVLRPRRELNNDPALAALGNKRLVPNTFKIGLKSEPVAQAEFSAALRDAQPPQAEPWPEEGQPPASAGAGAGLELGVGARTTSPRRLRDNGRSGRALAGFGEARSGG